MTDPQPWLANSEWVQKRISGTGSSNTENAKGIWLSGVFALTLGAVGLLVSGSKTWDQKNPLGLALLIFPLAGIALLYWSAVLNARARRYAGTYFQMESVPFFAGEKLRGTVHAPFEDFKEPVRLRLNCVRRTKFSDHSHGVGVGGAKITMDDLVWRQQQSVSATGATPGEKWIELPVEFAIPADAPTTDSANPDDRILWSLEASVKVRGVDFKQYFEVPVFTRSGIASRPRYGDPNIYAPIAVSLPAHPPSGDDRQVVERTTAGGGREFLFLAKRHWRIARFATVAFCVWTVVILYFLWGSDSYAFALFVAGDLLLLYWALWAWFSRSSASFGNGVVILKQSLFGVGTSKRVSYSDIRQVTSPIARESGQGTEAIPAYAIYLQTQTQGTVAVAAGLQNADEAGYIAETIRAEIGHLN